MNSGPQAGGGVAYAAHVGGFIAGLLLVKVFAIGRNNSSGNNLERAI
jgi:membrane associated rhomboid family serine protease